MKSFPGKRKQVTEPALDVILLLLEKAHELRPEAAFITSLLGQYRERGGLSKKQLEGLHSKASKIDEISPAHLATLQAIINKKQTHYKNEPSQSSKPAEEDMDEPMIDAILEKYPRHKRLLFFKMKKEKREVLQPPEKEELKKFYKLLIKS